MDQCSSQGRLALRRDYTGRVLLDQPDRNLFAGCRTSDDRRGIDALRPKRGHKLCGMTFWQRDQKPPRGLWIERDLHETFADRSIDGHLVVERGTIPAAAASQTALFRQSPRVWKERHLRRFEDDGHVAPARHLQRVPEQPES